MVMRPSELQVAEALSTLESYINIRGFEERMGACNHNGPSYPTRDEGKAAMHLAHLRALIEQRRWR